MVEMIMTKLDRHQEMELSIYNMAVKDALKAGLFGQAARSHPRDGDTQLFSRGLVGDTPETIFLSQNEIGLDKIRGDVTK